MTNYAGNMSNDVEYWARVDVTVDGMHGREWFRYTANGAVSALVALGSLVAIAMRDALEEFGFPSEGQSASVDRISLLDVELGQLVYEGEV